MMKNKQNNDWLNVKNKMPEIGQPFEALVYITCNENLVGEYILYINNEDENWDVEILEAMRWILEESVDCTLHFQSWRPALKNLPEFDQDSSKLIN